MSDLQQHVHHDVIPLASTLSECREEVGVHELHVPCSFQQTPASSRVGASQTEEQNGGMVRLHAIPPLHSNYINLPGKLRNYLYEKQLQLL